MLEPSSVNCVIYHADCTDGFGAAYSAWKLLGNRAEYYACKHGTKPPDIKGKNVVILDFSFDNKTTKRMIKSANELLVIDHHKSAMVELHDITNTHFDMNKSGAMLAWDFFHPGKEAPKFIQYIQDRDLWKWELPYSKEFSAAFDMVPYDLKNLKNLRMTLFSMMQLSVDHLFLHIQRQLLKKYVRKLQREKLMARKCLL